MDASFQGFQPQGCRPDESPLCTILRYLFLVTDPKTFLKAPSAPIYTNFEGGSRAKKRNFLVKIFQKSLKTPFWPVFSKFWLRLRSFGQNGVFIES